MDWVRGGTWVQSGDFPNLPEAAVFTILPNIHPRTHIQPAVDDHLPFWWWAIGEPAGLEPYEPTPAIASQAVTACEGIVDAFAAHDGSFVQLALDFLARFGPMSAVVGITPPLLVTNIGAAPNCVEGLHFWIDCAELADGSRLLNGLPGGALELSAVSAGLVRHARVALRDMEIVPTFRSAGVSYDARPMSLRSYLWKWLLWRGGRMPRHLCRYCGAVFAVEVSPGARPAYCPEHRSSRYRHAVRANRAPSMQVLSEFDEED